MDDTAAIMLEEAADVEIGNETDFLAAVDARQVYKDRILFVIFYIFGGYQFPAEIEFLNGTGISIQIFDPIHGRY